MKKERMETRMMRKEISKARKVRRPYRSTLRLIVLGVTWGAIRVLSKGVM